MPEITSYTALSSVESDDVLVVVDVHDTSMSAQGTTKKMTLSQVPVAGLAVSGTAAAGDSIAITGTSTAKFYAAPWRFVVGPDAAAQYIATGNGSTDDTAAFTNAIAAAVTYAASNGGLGLVSIEPPGAYYAINGALVNSGSLSGAKGNAQIPIPVNAAGGDKIKLVIQGLGGPGQSWPMWTQTATPWGGVPLVSNGIFAGSGAQGTNLNTYGDAVVLGGPNPVNGYGTNAALYNNITVAVEGISILTALSTTGLGYGAVDFSGTSQAQLIDFACGANTTYENTWAGSGNAGLGNFSRGILMPMPGNNDLCILRNVTIYGGYNYAILLTEHCVADALRVLYCGAGLCPVGAYTSGGGAAHAIKVLQASIEDCQVEIYAVGTGDNGITYFDCDQLDWEGTTFGFYDNTSGTSTAALRGDIRLAGYIPSGVTVQGSAYTGPSQFGGRLIWEMTSVGWQTPPGVPNTNTALVNPFWRDADVYITSGGASVTAIEVNGTSTGLTLGSSGTVLVPVSTGETITLTYASTAPTWAWKTK